jgi:hypothetical protein
MFAKIAHQNEENVVRRKSGCTTDSAWDYLSRLEASLDESMTTDKAIMDGLKALALMARMVGCKQLVEQGYLQKIEIDHWRLSASSMTKRHLQALVGAIADRDFYPKVIFEHSNYAMQTNIYIGFEDIPF